MKNRTNRHSGLVNDHIKHENWLFQPDLSNGAWHKTDMSKFNKIHKINKFYLDHQEVLRVYNDLLKSISKMIYINTFIIT